MQRYPVIGGMAAWRLPALAALLALAGVSFGAMAWAIGLLGLAWLANQLWRCVVVEVSPDGLARGLLVEGHFLWPPASIAWSAVVAVETDWCHPGDHSGLETRVLGRDGTTIHLSTAMGLRSYWACLAAIVRQAPRAASAGLTAEIVTGGPPAGRDVVAAAATAGALATVLVALVGVYYLWAQGRSSLSRELDGPTAPDPRAREACDPTGAGADGGTWPALPCRSPGSEGRAGAP